MKIMVLSDIHLGTNRNVTGRDLLPPFLEYLKEENPDLLIIAGDISDYYKTSINVLNAIEKISIKVLFIPGNHDIWVGHNENSWKAYESFKNHSSSLIGKPFVLNDDFVIIGDMGWYDYTFGPSELSKEHFEAQKKRLGRDALYAKWNKKDSDVLNYTLNNLIWQLEKFKDKKIIFVNHFIPFDDFIITTDSNDDWNVGNAYMGSSLIGELIERYKNIEWVIFGHTHHKFGTLSYQNKFNVICNPLGYVDEWIHNSFEEELKLASSFIYI